MNEMKLYVTRSNECAENEVTKRDAASRRLILITH